jgi:hypothetical protein
MAHKIVHLVAFLLVVVAGFVLVNRHPELLVGASTSLGTIGTILTVYGVVFAIVELMRAKASIRIAGEQSGKVLQQVTKLVAVREIEECYASVRMAVEALDASNGIPNALVVRIIKSYSQIFASELDNPKSDHRKNLSVLESYVFQAESMGKDIRAVPKPRTMKALSAIVRSLGTLQGQHGKFEELKNDPSAV